MEGRRPYTPLVFCLALLAKADAFVCPNPALSSSPSAPQRCESELVQNAASGTMSSPFQALTKAVGGAEDVRVTFLESNSWMWQVAGVNLLIDPVMYTLDFGVPSLIQGKKNVVNGDASLKQLAPDVDWVLISQGFDDHCHPATLEKAVKLLGPGVKFVAPPSARGVLEQYFPASRVVYLSPGQSTAIGKKGNSKATITVVATTGDTLGPPWQAPENGYVLQFDGKKYKSLYYEPHCRFDVAEFEKLGLTADVLVTPIIKQQLLGLYPLVNGQAKAVELARALKAKVVVPMNNGELDLSDSSWAFKNLVKKVGTLGEFKRLLEEGLPGTAVKEAPPGVSVAV